MKNSLHLLTCILLANGLNAQPTIQWSKIIGGSSGETAFSILEVSDGGYLVTGTTGSNDGDISGYGGKLDAYIAKLNNVGNIEWQQVLGGSEIEYANDVVETTDGGFLVVGYSSSTDGELPVINGSTEGLVIKFGSTGNIEWQRILGGSDWDIFNRVFKTSDGGYILVGTTSSIDGDVTENNGGTDCWLVKTDGSGNIEWQKTYGGSQNEVGLTVESTSDGGYIVGSNTNSNDGDVTGYHANPLDLNAPDYWFFKTNNSGTLEWQKAMGGSWDEILWGVIQSKDGGYMAIGTAHSIDGDIINNYGKSDIWLVKVDSSGVLNWQMVYGDIGYDVIKTTLKSENDGYVFCGRFGGLSEGFGLCKIDESGALIWQAFYGGDICYDIQTTTDKGYIMAGYSSFVQVDVPINYGSSDILIFKLSPEFVHTEEPKNTSLQLFPNPTSQFFTVKLPSEELNLIVNISDLLGQPIKQQTIQNGDFIDIHNLPNGVYSVEVRTLNGKVYSSLLFKV